MFDQYFEPVQPKSQYQASTPIHLSVSQESVKNQKATTAPLTP